MSGELAETLKSWAPLVESGYEVPAAGKVMREAATTLATMAETIARVERERDEALKRFSDSTIGQIFAVLKQRAEDAEARADTLASEVEELRELLHEARQKGLIYWEPQTDRGSIAKADMLARIDAALDSTGGER